MLFEASDQVNRTSGSKEHNSAYSCEEDHAYLPLLGFDLVYIESESDFCVIESIHLQLSSMNLLLIQQTHNFY